MSLIDEGEEPPLSQQPPVSGVVAKPEPDFDPLNSASIIALQAQLLAQQAEIDTLHAKTLAQEETIGNLIGRSKAAFLTLPCPYGYYLNMPADGWTGKPSDAPGATLATVEQCLAAHMCHCNTGRAVTPSAYDATPPTPDEGGEAAPG